MALNAPPLLHDRYRILAKLGQSRLAAVYRAEDERLKRPVLVHLLRQELIPTLSERFSDEARRGAQRSHPGLLEVYDTGEVGQRPYMITEDVEGQPLSERVPLPPTQALAVLRTIVGAVALAQTQGAPHPPISSQNVWLLPGGRALLLENWQMSPGDATLDAAHYRAPERGHNTAPSPATAVYALGILAWETLVGRRPYTGVTPEAIAAAHTANNLPPLHKVVPYMYAPGLNRIIQQAAAADPQLRYPTPTDFGRALDLLVDTVTAQTGRLQAPARQAVPRPAPVATPPGTSRDTQVLRAAPAPAPVHQEAPVRRSFLPRPQRRAVAPPAAMPPALVAAPVPAVAMPADSAELTRQAERAERRRQRQRGCQRAVLRLAWRLAALVAIVMALLVGGSYAYSAIESYVTGQVQRWNPRSWVAERLPDWSWTDGLFDDVVPDVPLATSYRVAGPLNLRDGPSRNAARLRELPVGTIVRALGNSQVDEQGLEWINVVTTDGVPQRGWVANLPNLLIKQ